MPSLADLLEIARASMGPQPPPVPPGGIFGQPPEQGPLESLLRPYSGILGRPGGRDPFIRLPVNPLNPWASLGNGPRQPSPRPVTGPVTGPSGPTPGPRADYTELATRYGPLVDPGQGPSDLRLQRDALGSLRRAGLPLDSILGGSYRSHEQQARLYATDSERFASPGSSLHEYGLAIDIAAPYRDTPQFLNVVKPALFASGWYQERPDEPWHFSYGVFTPAPQPRAPHAPGAPAPTTPRRRRRGATSGQLR